MELPFLSRSWQRAQTRWRRYTQFRQIQIKRPIEFHGTRYGGWTICPVEMSANSIVYSFGVGEDASFDLSLIQKYGCSVFAFDPTPRSIHWVQQQTLPEQFHFFDCGIADFDGEITFYPPENPDHVSHTVLYREATAPRAIKVPVKRLETLLQGLGHTRIDILKMDIEGAEYVVIPDILKTDVEIGQILVEFHHRFLNISMQQTQAMIALLNEAGYRLLHISASGEEYAFIKVE